ncbi:MAG: type I DNA topoisomerase [Candidatus Pacebacteria bacterium]|jgi:DNA topoisomerase-1|nr:type I DNA topoisomerase [Candidatus Paceibacterota bacterium]
MKLLIVESPAKAKTIEKYLDGKYTVRASVGHIRDLPKSQKKAIDIPAGFVPHYEISKGKEKVVDELAALAKKADEVVLATDPDREGEAISWHLTEALGLKNTKARPVKRAVFHEITKDAVAEALIHPRDIDEKLVKAQEARRVLDRLFGYDLSGLIWKKVRYGLSAGRVQSPALRILMEREREIRAFIPETYYVLSGLFKTRRDEDITLFCEEEPRDKARADYVAHTANTGNWKIDTIKESEMKRSPKAPFTTSTLQQTASSRLGFSPSRTMSIAQKLYEAGMITYMRTDSTTLSKQAQAQICSLVESEYGKDYLEARVFKTKSKNAQEAHEAVRPTHIELHSAGTTDEQKRLYRLIWERTVASQMSDAKMLKTKVSATVENEKNFPVFSAIGSRLLFPGWLKVDTASRGDDVELPETHENEALRLKELITEEKQTTPPDRYSEAGLVKELEKRGIGRPSTYASIIRTIEERGYVTKQNRTLFPTDTGEVVSTFIEQNFTKYISDAFTAEMEDELDEIAEGKRTYEKTLKEFYGPFLKEVKAKDKIEKITNLGDAPDEFPCPKCEAKMIVKLGKNGKFLSCSRFPDCDGARTMEGKEMEGPKETGELCPLCGDKEGKNGGGKLIEREGRFGKFISCNRYPKCKFIKEDEEEKKKKMTGVTCPMCSSGEMMERRGRFGIFYSCTNYPDCKHAIKAKPTGRICDLCNSLMMEGTKTIPERCSNKNCKNHNPHKHKGE